MARVSLLEGEITCPVCFDIYEDPQILRECFHTVCMKCVKQLQRRGEVRCPECRQFTCIANVRKDFKIQRFIDIYQAKNEHCGLCKDDATQITHNCLDCNTFLCSGCAKVHQKSKVLTSHIVKPMKLMSKVFESNIETGIVELEKQVKDIDNELAKISATHGDVQSSNVKQIEQVRRFTQNEIICLKENEKRVEKLVNDANNKLLNHLEQTEKYFRHQKIELQSKIALLKDTIKGQDIRILQETADSVNDNIKDDINKIKEKLQRIITDLKSPVTLEKRGNMDLQIEVMVDDIKFDTPQIEQSVSQGVYSQLIVKTFQASCTTELDYIPRRLLMKNNELYCANPKLAVIHVYDKECQLVRTIKNDQIIDMQSFMFLDTGDMVVAGRRGLFKLDQSGQNCTKISNGHFSDVDCYDGDLYALDFKDCNITVLRSDNIATDGWIPKNKFEMNYPDSNTCDRIEVHSGRIYISSFSNDYILVYNTDGQLLCQIGETGIAPGQFKSPTLCGIDRANNMLVADCTNSRLQVHDNNGQWHPVSLSRCLRGWPVDAVVTQDGQMWIVENGIPCGTLTKFTSECE